MQRIDLKHPNQFECYLYSLENKGIPVVLREQCSFSKKT